MKQLSGMCLAGLLAVAGCLAACGDEAGSPNLPPVAVAGPDQAVEVRKEALLDGTLSYDPDGDPIFFEWTLASTSGLIWVGPDKGAQLRLTPRVEGVYTVRLQVNDGTLWSEPDIVRVYAIEAQVVCQSDLDCDDDNVCTDDSCSPLQKCIHEFNQEPCDDGFYCTSDDQCDGTGICVGTGSPCLEECLTSCNENEQRCETSPDGTPCGQGSCQDGDWVGDVCQDGACTGSDVIVCDDDNECTEDSCDDSSGCQNQDVPDATPCNSGLGVCCAGLCTQNQECCQALDCGENTDCILYACLEGVCDRMLLDPGIPCDGGDGDLCDSTCDGNGDCIDQAVGCDDGEFCNGRESCDPADGSCSSDGNLGGGTHCHQDQLIQCDGNGSAIGIEDCALGCNQEADPQRCYLIDPSNFDPDLLCEGTYDAVLSGQVVIDTDNRTIIGGDPGLLVVNAVAQDPPARDLAVFSFHSLTIEAGAEVTVIGQRALALAVCTDVVLEGVIDASASGQTGGPGGFDGGDPDQDGQGPSPGEVPTDGWEPCPDLCVAGSGGAGYGEDGGDGGDIACDVDEWIDITGGADGNVWGQETLTPLTGGGGGAGGVTGPNEPTSAPGAGGGGGGAVQITAGNRLNIGATGGVSVAGGGGGMTVAGGGAGGGSGGAILLEAGWIEIADGGFLAANGGGGGSGDCT